MAPWYFYSPDDLYIHLRFADNLVNHGEWAFNPGEPVAGATSPPWVLLLASCMAAGASGPVAAKALATAAAVALVLLAGMVCQRSGSPLTLAALATVCIAGSHWLRLWSAAGMETPLPPLLLLAGLAAGLAGGDRVEQGTGAAEPEPGRSLPGRRRLPAGLAAGLLLGVATTARPDAAPAALVLCAMLLLRLTGAARWRLLGAAVSAALLWPLLSRLTLGSWLPLPVGAKGGAVVAAGLVLPALARTVIVAASEMAPLLVLLLVAVLRDEQVRRRHRRWLPILLAAATLPAGYGLNQMTAGTAASGRYLVPWFVLVVVAVLIAVEPWWRDRRRQRWVLLAAGLTLVQSAALTVVHAPACRRYDDYHQRSLLRAAHWLRQNAGPTDTVVAGDIGVLGYVGKMRVLDVAGIINPEARQWAEQGTTFAEIRRRQPRFFMDPGWYPGFDRNLLEPFTRRVVLQNEHRSYRWSLHPGRFTASLRELAWEAAAKPGHRPDRPPGPATAVADAERPPPR